MCLIPDRECLFQTRQQEFAYSISVVGTMTFFGLVLISNFHPGALYCPSYRIYLPLNWGVSCDKSQASVSQQLHESA